jgi:hypothetical protein
VHVDVHRQQVVAALDAAVDHLVEEVMTRHPLADQASLLVGKDDEDGVDLVRRRPSGSGSGGRACL